MPAAAAASYTIHLGGVYRCGPILLEMVPNAQKHLEVADLYEQLSADENASLQTRLAFARKANWHRILARMSAEREHPVIKEKASDGEQALRSETTDQRTDGGMEGNTDQAADRKHRPNRRLIPMGLRQQENPDIRSQTTADISQKEV